MHTQIKQKSNNKNYKKEKNEDADQDEDQDEDDDYDMDKPPLMPMDIIALQTGDYLEYRDFEGWNAVRLVMPITDWQHIKVIRPTGQQLILDLSRQPVYHHGTHTDGQPWHIPNETDWRCRLCKWECIGSLDSRDEKCRFCTKKTKPEIVDDDKQNEVKRDGNDENDDDEETEVQRDENADEEIADEADENEDTFIKTEYVSLYDHHWNAKYVFLLSAI